MLAVRPCHISMCSQSAVHVTLPCVSMVSFHVNSTYIPHQHCTECTVSKKFLIWKRGKNAISHSHDVCLNSFKLCSYHEDEAYIHVCFEAIPSTFIFEHILIPWIKHNPTIRLPEFKGEALEDPKKHLFIYQNI
jgi:hypothetical protein